MIEQQIRPWEVLDQRTLDLFDAVHREDFVPAEFRHFALSDTGIPLPHGEVTMAPKVEARMIQSLAIAPGDRVLEIGTGCAFVTALLARVAAEVHSVDIHSEFIETARAKLGRSGPGNVTLHCGDAARGWPAAAPYDAIAVTGSVPTAAHATVFERELRVGGRLFVITGEPPVMDAVLVTRVGEREWARESLFETVLPPLLHLAPVSRFRF